VELTMKYGRLNDSVLVGPVQAAKWGDLWMYFSEVATGIVTGDLPLDDFDKWVSFFDANGGREIIQEATELNR